MSTVTLSSGVKSQILNQVQRALAKGATQPPPCPRATSEVVANEAYELMLPEFAEKQLLAAAPDWFLPKTEAIYLALNDAVYNDASFYRIGYYGAAKTYAPLGKTRIMPSNTAVIRNVVGLEEARWVDGILTLKPATDGSIIAQPNLRAFVEDMQAIAKQHQDAKAEADKAVSDMSTFLDQHASLNSAAKAFGPSIWQYVPEYLKVRHDAVVTRKPRTVKPKTEPIEVDISHLVARAVTQQLNLN